MRLAVFHNLQSGGAHRSMLGFCRELGRHHEIEVFTLTSADQDMLRDEDLGFAVTRFPFRWQPPRRGELYLNDWRLRANLVELDRTNRRAAAQIDRGGYDAVLVDGCRYTFAPPLLQYVGSPSVYMLHHRPRRIDEHHMPAPLTPYQRLRGLWHWPLEQAWERHLWRVEARSMRHARLIISNSSFTHDQLRRTHGLESRVCPPGTTLPAQVGAGDGSYVLGVGELEARKGFDFLVEALAGLPPQERPALKIVANGGNPRVRELLEAQARREAVDLTVITFPAQSELARLYREAQVFLYGSHEEPLGLAPLEAMAAGRPVVAVAEGGVRETVLDEETGYLVARSPLEFGRRVRQLLGSPAQRARMGAAARSHIERNWTWPTRAAALERELLQLTRTAHTMRVPA